MRLHEDPRGQIYTIEGIVASLILLSVLLFILQSNSIIVPQTERSIDMKLYERASDTMICLDWSSNDSWSPMAPLSEYVTEWDGTSTQASLAVLDSDLASLLPKHVQYNVNFIYYDGSGDKKTTPVIVKGIPGDNSVVSTRLVTLNEDEASDYWKNNVYTTGGFPHIVEVKLTCWYV